ncbi:EAL domain-containing protein [Achromobacter xylosoxidans]|uniref:EAL domain-containing protein n=1 Tax=Alcaligenes xylosoxydans xylosoxydans TaxID=85698 RepID=UPI0006BF5B2C|nr:EAL domain-containing protein [Achromobacter xylosoxidans]MCH1984801.1 EAL domain-containing protein [Achromobacter xylosoxidans]MCH1992711.1 EAL domain-containing protein [Achromobacter xylosoxidans]MCH4584468.1 EAL domain-containing protein [Achromobacter xylosoxidans]CUI39176.1 Bacteriophytochrome cph2 [Achromobacter xylosoxidans]
MARDSVQGRGYATSTDVLVIDESGDRFRLNEREGYRTVAAGSLEAATRMLATRPFDAVVCGVSEGRPEGIALPSVLLGLRQRGKLHTLPAVIWCGNEKADLELLASHARVALAAGVRVQVLPDSASEVEFDLALQRSEPECVAPLADTPNEKDLVSALVSGDQFRIVLQPQFDLASRKIVGAEALARWRHPTLGEVSPAVFVPLVNKAGLDLLLFHLVEARVAALLGELAKQEIALPISVNASATTLCSAGLSNRLERRLQAAGVSNSLLKIELTEDIPSQDPLALSTALSSLRMRGFQVAVDDFGCGFASFDLLTQMPFSELKVDRRFVQAMDVDTGCAAAVAASIAMAKALRLDVVAEGIETEWQIESLLRQGCRIGQGYALSAPLEVDPFLLFVAGERSGQSTTAQ